MAIFKKRSLLKTTLLTFCTLGLYDFYYLIVTKRELNQAGGYVPTAWLLLVPFLNLYFVYCYAQSYVTIVKKDRSMTQTIIYCLLLLSPILVYLISLYGGFHYTQYILSMIINYFSGVLFISYIGFENTDFLMIFLVVRKLIRYILLIDIVISAKIAIFQDGYNESN